MKLRNCVMIAVAMGAVAMGTVVEAKPKVVRQIPVTKEFITDEIKPSTNPKGYKFKMRMIVVDGIIEICGVGVHRDAMLRRSATEYLRNPTLSMNGKVIMRDFRFFNTVKSVKALETAKANCASTGTRAPKGKPKWSWGGHGARF